MTQEHLEAWRAISDFEGVYEVSNIGRVRRLVGSHTSKTYPAIVPGYLRHGYPAVHLYHRGRRRERLVHRLMLETFVGPQPKDSPHGAHRNDVPTDNRLDNLYWATPQENMDDRTRNGGTIVGTAQPLSRLTDGLVRTIRADPRPYRQIAAEL